MRFEIQRFSLLLIVFVSSFAVADSLSQKEKKIFAELAATTNREQAEIVMFRGLGYRQKTVEAFLGKLTEEQRSQLSVFALGVLRRGPNPHVLDDLSEARSTTHAAEMLSSFFGRQTKHRLDFVDSLSDEELHSLPASVLTTLIGDQKVRQVIRRRTLNTALSEEIRQRHSVQLKLAEIDSDLNYQSFWQANPRFRAHASVFLGLGAVALGGAALHAVGAWESYYQALSSARTPEAYQRIQREGRNTFLVTNLAVGSISLFVGSPIFNDWFTAKGRARQENAAGELNALLSDFAKHPEKLDLNTAKQLRLAYESLLTKAYRNQDSYRGALSVAMAHYSEMSPRIKDREVAKEILRAMQSTRLVTAALFPTEQERLSIANYTAGYKGAATGLSENAPVAHRIDPRKPIHLVQRPISLGRIMRRLPSFNMPSLMKGEQDHKAVLTVHPETGATTLEANAAVVAGLKGIKFDSLRFGSVLEHRVRVQEGPGIFLLPMELSQLVASKIPEQVKKDVRDFVTFLQNESSTPKEPSVENLGDGAWVRTHSQPNTYIYFDTQHMPNWETRSVGGIDIFSAAGPHHGRLINRVFADDLEYVPGDLISSWVAGDRLLHGMPKGFVTTSLPEPPKTKAKCKGLEQLEFEFNSEK